MAEEQLVNRYQYVTVIEKTVAIGVDLQTLDAVAAKAGPLVTTGNELLVFAPPGAGKTFNAEGNWIDGDKLCIWPIEPTFWRVWTGEQQMQLGLAHLKVVTRVSRAARKVVAFNPNIEALFLYGSSDLNVVIWLPRRESHLVNIAKREIGKPDSSESIYCASRLEEAARYFGWTVCYGDVDDLKELLAHRRYQQVSVRARGPVPREFLHRMVLMKVYAQYLRDGVVRMDCVDNTVEGNHLYLYRHRGACICHGTKAVYNELDGTEMYFVEAILRPTLRGLAIVRIVHEYLGAPIPINSPLLEVAHVSSHIHDDSVRKNFFTDVAPTFETCREIEYFGVSVEELAHGLDAE